MNPEERRTVEAMQFRGGSFVQALSQCFILADPDNFKKLKETFNEYWKEYSDIGIIIEKDQKEYERGFMEGN